MVTIINYFIIFFILIFSAFSYGEGSYELRGKSSSNDQVRIEGKRHNYSPAITLGLPRVTVFSIDIEDSDNEVIDIYSSNPNKTTSTSSGGSHGGHHGGHHGSSTSSDSVSVDIAIWCPDNTPSNPSSANAHESANAVFNVSKNGDGYIDSWSDVLAVQNISTRPRDPKTFSPASYNCSSGVYTVRLYTHAIDDSRSFSNGLEYMDIMVRNKSTNNNYLERGRVFSKHYSLIQDGFSRELNFKVYVVEGNDYGYEYNGFVWEMDANGMQPYSFQLVSNNTGTTDESQHDKSVPISSSPSPTMEAQYNIYLNYPDKHVSPPSSQPDVSNFFYHNICESDNDVNGYTQGGYFNFYSNGNWKYKLYIDINNDGVVTLDEKVFQGTASSGLNRVYWDGILPSGEEVPNGTNLSFNLYLSDGEVHFPWSDVENRYTEVGPIITLKSASTQDSINYYWDDSILGGTTANMNGTSVVRTWGDNIGDKSLMDTWKYAYNSGLKKNVIYGGECEVPDLGGNVSGYVFHDENHNGSKEYGESGIEDVTIVLHNITNNDCETQKTDSNGYFLFDNILMSEFNLVESANETLPIAFKCPPIEEDPAGYISVDSNTKPVVFNELNASYLTFANYKGYKVSGNTFIDNGLGGNKPNNGIKDGDETSFSNIKIEAKEQGSVFETIYTNGDGEFTFWIPSSKPIVSIEAESKLDFINVSSSLGDTSGSKTNFDKITFSGQNETFSGVSFGYSPETSLSQTQTQTIQAGSVTYYTHKYKVNNIGSVEFSITDEKNIPSSNNSNSIIYEDKNCNGILDSGVDSSVSSSMNVNLNTNNEICLIVKVITQTSAPNNSSYSYSLNALTTYNYIPLSINKKVISITLITDSNNNSNLKLLKKVDKNNALPNEIITYEVEITNNGQDKIDNIKVDDFTPDYTNFVLAECPKTLTPSLISCEITESPDVGSKGSVKWEFTGELLSGENITILYKVRVDN